MGEEKRLDCGVFDAGEMAKIINDMAGQGTPMRHMQRRQDKAVTDGYVVSARVDKDGKLFGVVERY